ncbi:undecaprenyldiphospho-muramoylpentapeptide beta-N-acetylglucosaminyltransferase [Cytobacillus oceanisediminis]|uniref:UDP-N-acetylglucosamine--N-acetylmuramyl-(pentapeptide) pyrophosphoryl-undecaprenol N-acetylglucosamine transferase n=2 Tax=Niallia TaxID=2837506 RepID=A0A941GD04_NIACI|nr:MULTISPECIES: undecaprenyldiphospho-muramoylpentapeptide beta-N-acetylglucosaminyltransferase [Bacillaceae]EOR22877.1 glycosyltransferase Family transferase [Niallia nealsonii AAU1]MBQ6449076.1 undecaprenyldiphospho-muramoylpentapeptide beta-N-acetylglucosaminyltransferase [Bacillus sp. (in: firmicutes)]MDU1844011.1 undecaprenyldiphospho-muramoylpentapeptide beta-N-acetylglucosaminyltransferase [Niallia nealsonii]MBZ9536382.1 undecaprenyldiphospho-muramoylpentapeptide beta-N-acetylglucosamin
MKKIVFTGGGSAGHVTPNIAIINELNKQDWDIAYIGSKAGIEKDLIEKIDIPYHPISSGKLRRYISKENIKDIFKVIKGCYDARKVLKKIKPNVVFSKGGFVSVPVVIAARQLKIPVILHESDLTPGLANKLSVRFASKIFTSFEETLRYLPKEKSKAIGSPIRKEILTGSVSKGRLALGFTSQKPILTIMGGSLGAKKINEVVRDNLETLLQTYQIVHLCGKGNLSEKHTGIKGYQQFEYVYEELADILAATEVVVTRGGSNSIFEFLALKIPMLIIPLTKQQSRGDQILNGKVFTENGYSYMIEEEALTKDHFLNTLKQIQENKQVMIEKMEKNKSQDALEEIIKELNRY